VPSPFPGVDPYIEASGRWLGFHNVFITYLNEFLNQRLPEHYAATVDERIQLLDISDLRGRDVLPDEAVIRDSAKVPSRASAADSSAALAEPQTLTLPDYVEVHEAYIDVIDLPGRELVTTLEVLSPTNKSGVGRGQYLAKRRALLRRGINLVEIDLLSAGERLETVEPLPPADYYAFVSRGNRRPKCEVYAWGVRWPLPSIPVPLKAPDPRCAAGSWRGVRRHV